MVQTRRKTRTVLFKSSAAFKIIKSDLFCLRMSLKLRNSHKINLDIIKGKNKIIYRIAAVANLKCNPLPFPLFHAKKGFFINIYQPPPSGQFPQEQTQNEKKCLHKKSNIKINKIYFQN